MRGALHALIGLACVFAGLLSLPYLFMVAHDLLDSWRGEWHGSPWWTVYLGVGLIGSLSLGAFLMAYRFLRYAVAAKPTS